MGIHFFSVWLKTHFSSHIKPLTKKQTLTSIGTLPIDNLLVDMNGLIHNSAQRIYEYGNYKKPISFLSKRKKYESKNEQELRFFKDVCSSLESLVDISEPQKRLILCVDGVAPFGKTLQQRKRRFRYANDLTPQPFDTSSISVGTVLMDKLDRYLDIFFKKSINSNWKHLEIVYSSYKVPGEGEQALMSYIRKHGTDDESYCITGLDADIIMLALASHRPKFYVLRDDLYEGSDYLCLDIKEIRNDIVKMMKFDNSSFNAVTTVNDFVFICYLVGNDFLQYSFLMARSTLYIGH